MIQIYNDKKGTANSFEASLAEPETWGVQPLYGFGASPQQAAADLKRALEQRITKLQQLDFTQVTFVE